MTGFTFFFLIVEGFIFVNLALVLGSLCTWIERKGSALIQNRVGANRAGAFTDFDFIPAKPFLWVWNILGRLGLLNTLIADGVKAIFKEDFVPSGVSKFLHGLGPVLAVAPVVVAFGLIPLAPDFELFGYTIRLQMSGGVDTGVLIFLALGSLAVYGVILAGWTGNNKFSLLGSLRAAAQMISYELAMGVSLATVIITFDTLDLYQMVEAQKALWGIIASPMMFIAGVIFFIAGMAETKRAPFDLPESESELVAGYFTEYSGMKFLLFWLAEFCEIALVAMVMTVVFFGGWHPLPFVNLPEGFWGWALAGHVILMAKVFFFCLLQIVIRWTLPRFRYDQLMNLGWKILLEIAFVNVIITAAWKLYRNG